MPKSEPCTYKTTVKLTVLIISVFYLFISYVNASTGVDETPSQFIESLYKSISGITESDIGENTKLQQIRTRITQNIDIEKISTFVLGRHARNIPAQQLAKFSSAYQNYLASKYSKLIMYNAKKVKIIKTEDLGNNRYIVTLEAQLKDKKNALVLSYLMWKDNMQYKIIDVILAGGIRLTFADRDEFSNFLQNRPMPQALDLLIDKLNAF